MVIRSVMSFMYDNLSSMKQAQMQTLKEDTKVEGVEFAKGSQYKVFETKNFGWLVFHSSSKTPSGGTPSRIIFQY